VGHPLGLLSQDKSSRPTGLGAAGPSCPRGPKPPKAYPTPPPSQINGKEVPPLSRTQVRRLGGAVMPSGHCPLNNSFRGALPGHCPVSKSLRGACGKAE